MTCLWWTNEATAFQSSLALSQSFSVYLHLLLQTHLQSLCIFLCQLTISPSRPISDPITTKAKGADLLDRLSTNNTFGCYIRVLCSKPPLIPVVFDPWVCWIHMTLDYETLVCPNMPSRKWWLISVQSSELHDEDIVTDARCAWLIKIRMCLPLDQTIWIWLPQLTGLVLCFDRSLRYNLVLWNL